MPQTVFQRVLQIAQEQERTLEEPCLELGCTVQELEQRLNRLEPRVVEEVSKWLGISYYSFFAKEGEEEREWLKRPAQRRLWDLTSR